MDVKIAFLHGDLKETIYMEQPIGFIDKNHPEHVCLLQRSIYGLKQSPRLWNKKFDACMLSLGFLRSKYDACLYFKSVKSDMVIYVLLYVADILLISNSKPTIAKLKSKLKQHFDMKDLGAAQKILGVKILRNRIKGTLYLSQADYITKVLNKFAMLNSKPSPIPLRGHLVLSKADCPSTESDKHKMNDIPYDIVVGSVMYDMLCTRPDLAFALGVLSRFMSNPGNAHWTAMKYVLKYIAGTQNLGLVYKKYETKIKLKGYVDSDYASNKDTRKSTTALYFTWAGNCISWKSQQQSIVTLSSTKVEYIVAVEAIKEAMWLQGILGEIQNTVYIPTMNIDSQSVLYLCKDPVYHERTKHIDVRYHFIRDKIENGSIVVTKIAGETNPTDFGTKIVPSQKFEFCRDFLHIGAVA
ncbi:unnamed protein product [Rhodiola kirilowii]